MAQVAQDIVDYSSPEWNYPVKINKTQGLYVISCGTGYTCLGFYVCLARSIRLYEWLFTRVKDGLRNPSECELGSYDAWCLYKALQGMAEVFCFENKVRCNAELSPQLIGLEGYRVEVEDSHGEKRRFIVGKSTGWCPCHLEIKRRNSFGGMAADRAYKTVRTLEKVR